MKKFKSFNFLWLFSPRCTQFRYQKKNKRKKTNNNNEIHGTRPVAHEQQRQQHCLLHNQEQNHRHHHQQHPRAQQTVNIVIDNNKNNKSICLNESKIHILKRKMFTSITSIKSIMKRMMMKLRISQRSALSHTIQR